MRVIKYLFAVLLTSFAGRAFADEIPVVKMVRSPFGAGLYVPNDGRSHPGVLLLHGSGGGLKAGIMLKAQALAAQGYAAFAFCYAGCSTGTEADTYRPNLETIDVNIERTADAFAWLASSPHAAGHKVALYGVSRGAEQALLLASLLARDPARRSPDAVAVHAPSDVIVGGWNWYWRDDVCLHGAGGWNSLCGAAPPADDAHWPLAWTYPPLPEAVSPGARIEVERISAPVLITHGEEDLTWSVERTKHIRDAMERAGLRPEVHLFPGEGHGLHLEAQYQADVYLLTFLKRVLN